MIIIVCLCLCLYFRCVVLCVTIINVNKLCGRGEPYITPLQRPSRAIEIREPDMTAGASSVLFVTARWSDFFGVSFVC